MTDDITLHAPENRRARLASVARGAPSSFWALMVGAGLFSVAISIGMPYETIFVTEKLHVSIFAVGAVWTVSAFAGLPMQIVGGIACDRIGRRPLLAVSAAMIIVFYAVMAVAGSLWQVAIVAVLEAMIGWPLYLVACNAMIADLLPYERRPVAYSVWRAAINGGTVVGPAIAALLIASGLSYQGLFTCASAGCGVFLLIVVVWVKETRPSRAGRTADGDVTLVRGLHLVVADRRFVRFSLVALLPLFCLGQFLWIFPVYLTQTLHMTPRAWGWLLALSAATIAVLSAPGVHLTRRADKMLLMSAASLLIALGLGGTAFVSSLWLVVPLVLVFSVGEALLWPISSAAISEMAPVALRGTYMGAWTLVDCAGRGIGPIVGGWAMASLGGRQAFVLILLAGLAGAAAFPLLRQRRPRRPPESRSA